MIRNLRIGLDPKGGYQLLLHHQGQWRVVGSMPYEPELNTDLIGALHKHSITFLTEEEATAS